MPLGTDATANRSLAYTVSDKAKAKVKSNGKGKTKGKGKGKGQGVCVKMEKPIVACSFGWDEGGGSESGLVV